MLELKHRLISTTTLLILDVLWITLFMGPRYKVMIKNIQGSELKTNMLYAFLAYTLMVIGLNHFVLPNINVKNVTIRDCLSYGFLFGLVVYGVYDFTIGAVLKKWDMMLAIMDILWGGFVYFVSCYVLKFLN
tara:strand:- start:210 stop:605 length:396 start_codon:yes stop_codon:yes gene_type:complete